MIQGVFDLLVVLANTRFSICDNSVSLIWDVVYLGNHAQSNKIPHKTHKSCEDFLAVSASQMLWEQINNCRHKAFDAYKLENKSTTV